MASIMLVHPVHSVFYNPADLDSATNVFKSGQPGCRSIPNKWTEKRVNNIPATQKPQLTQLRKRATREGRLSQVWLAVVMEKRRARGSDNPRRRWAALCPGRAFRQTVSTGKRFASAI